MKIALVRRAWSQAGGAELYLDRLIGALATAGHEAHLFAESWGRLPEKVTLHPIAPTGSRSSRAADFATAVRDPLRNGSFDCVLSLERTLSQDVFRAGDGVHRVWLKQRRRFAPWWKRPFLGRGPFHQGILRLEQLTFDPANTRHVIANSEMVRREILEHFQFPPERIHLVRNGIDLERFSRGNREEARKKLGVTRDDFVILFAGSGWERKGLPFLLRAFARLLVDRSAHSGAERLKLVVAGKGKLSRHPAGVIFSGPVERMEDLYAAADLFVMVPIYDPSANVCIEALAAGVPVVTSAQNGAGEVIQEGVTGSVVPDPSDLGALCRAIGAWRARRDAAPEKLLRVQTPSGIDLERNVAETLAVLERAAGEKRG